VPGLVLIFGARPGILPFGLEADHTASSEATRNENCASTQCAYASAKGKALFIVTSAAKKAKVRTLLRTEWWM